MAHIWVLTFELDNGDLVAPERQVLGYFASKEAGIRRLKAADNLPAPLGRSGGEDETTWWRYARTPDGRRGEYRLDRCEVQE